MKPVPESEAFAERLRRALHAVGMRPSPTAVANEFNRRYRGRSISTHTVRNWLQGTAMPTQDKLLVLSDWLQISPETLRYGRIKSRLRFASGDQLEPMDLADREMIARYLSLSIYDRKTVRDVLAAMTIAVQVNQAKNEGPDGATPATGTSPHPPSQ